MPIVDAPWKVKRELLLKSEAETDPKHGHKPDLRPYPDLVRFGVINLDKPPGPTSHEVAAWVRRILNIKQTGHGGTLETFET